VAALAGEMILQPFVPGRPASVAFLLGAVAAVSLPPTAQHLSDDGRFRYLGGAAPLSSPWRQRAESLGRRAVEAVPGLRGYVGVDLVLGEDEGGDRVIEINPRLTTSYIGLRRLALSNLAETMLRAACGEPPGCLLWREGTITFRADGLAACHRGATGGE
jgi:predicted ATP-grasp superfamily ATP-dependent carboligase